jgi:hypothetical protein
VHEQRPPAARKRGSSTDRFAGDWRARLWEERLVEVEELARTHTPTGTA